MSSKSHNTSVLVFLLSFVLLSTSICFADSQEDASRKRALIISGVIFGATYVGTIVGDHVIDSSVNFSELYIPVVGPLLALSSYDDKVTNPYYTGRKRDKTLFVLSSAVQAVSAFIFIKNLSGHKKNTNSTALKALSNLSIHANGRGDFLASYRFQL